MKSSIRLGRLFGIEICLHFSWFLIALMITMSLSAQFQDKHGEWGPAVIWTTAILTALLFFAALLAHELSHALVARSRGLSAGESHQCHHREVGKVNGETNRPSRHVIDIDTGHRP